MRTISIVLPAESGLLINTSGCFVFHATRETTGSAAAVYRLWDGETSGERLLVPVSLSEGESTRDFFAAHIVKFETGLYYELVSGAVEGAVGVRVEHDCEQLENLAALMVLNGYPEP